MSITPAAMHHLALTVRDPDASVDGYTRAFGLTSRMDLPHPGGFAQMLSDDAWQLTIALHPHDSNSGKPFSDEPYGSVLVPRDLEHTPLETYAAPAANQ